MRSFLARKGTKSAATGGVIQSIAGRLAPELLLAIAAHVPRLDEWQYEEELVALLSFPLVCKAWRGPGRTALYERIELVNSEGTKLLLRTLRDNPNLGTIIKKITIVPRLKQGDADLKQWNKLLGQVPELRELDMPSRKTPGEGQFAIPDPLSNLGIALFPVNLPHLRRIRLEAQSRPWLELSIIMEHVEDLTLCGYRLGQPTAIDNLPVPRLVRFRLDWCIVSPTQLEAYLHRLRGSLRILEIADMECELSEGEEIGVQEACNPVLDSLTSFSFEWIDHLDTDSAIFPPFTRLSIQRLDILSFSEALDSRTILRAKTICVSLTGRQLSQDSALVNQVIEKFGEDTTQILPNTKIFRIVVRHLQDHRIDEQKFTNFCGDTLKRRAAVDGFTLEVKFEWERQEPKRPPKSKARLFR